MYVCTWVYTSEYTCPERTCQIPLDQELQVVMSCLTWVLGIELRLLKHRSLGNIKDPNYRSGLHVTHPEVEQPRAVHR